LFTASCTTHRVDVYLNSPKRLTQPFIDSVISLASAANKTDNEQKVEFRRFVGEFGTHFSTVTMLGVRLLSETRFSVAERELIGDERLKECNTMAGSKLVGLQGENDVKNCSQGGPTESHKVTGGVDRMIVSTFGSFGATNLR
jgi:hypothetical protein